MFLSLTRHALYLHSCVTYVVKVDIMKENENYQMFCCLPISGFVYFVYTSVGVEDCSQWFLIFKVAYYFTCLFFI